ncbi:hypothetical protein C8J57DRAFT_1568583 [Mycena rebaudengoi]|nr:hypothetical protein C8J57DRAFT_1568583 [Mycena rebaudengoi]
MYYASMRSSKLSIEVRVELVKIKTAPKLLSRRRSTLLGNCRAFSPSSPSTRPAPACPHSWAQSHAALPHPLQPRHVLEKWRALPHSRPPAPGALPTVTTPLSQIRIPLRCCPLVRQTDQQHQYSLHTSSSTSMARFLTLTRHENSVPVHDLASQQLATPSLRPSRTALTTTSSSTLIHPSNVSVLQRLALPRTFIAFGIFLWVALCSELTRRCPLDDPPHRNLCQRSALAGTTVPPTARRSAAAMDSELHLQFAALCRRFGLGSEVEGCMTVFGWSGYLSTNFTEFKTPHHSQFLSSYVLPPIQLSAASSFSSVHHNSARWAPFSVARRSGPFLCPWLGRTPYPSGDALGHVPCLCSNPQSRPRFFTRLAICTPPERRTPASTASSYQSRLSPVLFRRHQLSTPWVCVYTVAQPRTPPIARAAPALKSAAAPGLYILEAPRVAPLHKVRGLYERAAADGINKCEFHLDFIAPLHKLRHHRRISISRSRNMSGAWGFGVAIETREHRVYCRGWDHQSRISEKLPTRVWTIWYTPPIDAAGPTQAAATGRLADPTAGGTMAVDGSTEFNGLV